MTTNKDTEVPELLPLSQEEVIERLRNVLTLLESIDSYDSPLPKARVLLRGVIGHARVDTPAAPTAQCYWCKHPDHDNKVCPVPYLAQGAHGLAGSYPCGCSLSTVIPDAPDEHPAIDRLRAVRQTLAEYEDDEALQIEARAIDRFLDLESKQER